ncbi:MAG: HEAT repeat domain-containing protein [Spirochaetaceae bacterium]|nr:MAG: HEAT repeat domain-containing protein [Spirochaetaceae bacterium]
MISRIPYLLRRLTPSIIMMLLILSAGPLRADEDGESAVDEPLVSARNEWRDMLRFGIDSEVIELLPTLTENREVLLEPEVLRVFARSINPRLRRAALRYFTDLELTGAIDAVVELLSDIQDIADDLVLDAILYLSTVETDDRDDVAVLFHELARSRRATVAGAAVRAIGKTGDERDVDVLLDLFDERTTPIAVRQSLVLALGELRTPRAVDRLISVLGRLDDDPTLRNYAADALGKIGDDRAVDALRVSLGSTDALHRAYAVNALGYFDSPEVPDMLEEALRDSFWRVRVAALDAAGRRKEADLLPAVIYRARRDPETRVRLDAITAIAGIATPDAWEFLRSQFVDERVAPDIRRAILHQLVEHNAVESLPTIREVVQKEWASERPTMLEYTTRVLSTAKLPEASDIFVRLLDHPNFVLRIYGVRGIALNGLEQYKDRISEISENETEHASVRRNAAAELERMR